MRCTRDIWGSTTKVGVSIGSVTDTSTFIGVADGCRMGMSVIGMDSSTVTLGDDGDTTGLLATITIGPRD
jgi:hypothetical protein